MRRALDGKLGAVLFIGLFLLLEPFRRWVDRDGTWL